MSKAKFSRPNSIRKIFTNLFVGLEELFYLCSKPIIHYGRKIEHLLKSRQYRGEELMSTTAINVNKQTVLQLLGSGSKTPFIIPEYQRPYAWTEEQVITLFEDIWEFMTTSGGSQRDGTYFLGCVVSYENDNAEQEIIDGQQRITTLFLLLRAIYASLENANTQNDMTHNFLSMIGPALWRKGRLDGKLNHSEILISSRVVNNDGNAILKSILETGVADENAVDNYSANYRLLQNLFKQYAEKEPLAIFDFIYAVLEQSIMLPITADSQNTALIIFNTLNARGLPLSDADIFKAKIYNKLDTQAKQKFIERWKKLDDEATRVDESMQSLFLLLYVLSSCKGRGL